MALTNSDILELVRDGRLPRFYQTPRKQQLLERKVARNVSRRLKTVFDDYGSALKTDPLTIAQNRALSTISTITPELQEDIEDLYLQGSELGYARGTKLVLVEFGNTIFFDDWLAKNREYIRTLVGNRVKNVTDSLRSLIRANVDRVVDGKVTQQQAAARVASRSRQVSLKRGLRIVRTETSASVNNALYDGLKDGGTQFIQWLTAQDSRVRERHIIVHGEVVRMGGRFSNGMARPADPSAPLEDRVNERCSFGVYVPRRGEQDRATPFLGVN